MNIAEELNRYNVSRETYNKLDKFVVLLTEWNNKMNLVSKKSLDDVWQRHVFDSVQLIDYIPTDAKHIVDIGSGSGFPSIVLAVLLQEKNAESRIDLVESIAKKAKYLEDVKTELNLTNVNIINNRVENVVFKNVNVVTARAVASLDVLFEYVKKIGTMKTTALFLKGKSYVEEMAVADKKWQYDCQVYKNRYSEDGVIMQIQNIRNKR